MTTMSRTLKFARPFTSSAAQARSGAPARSRRLTRAAAVLAVSGGLVLAGCGSDDTAATDSGATAAPSASAAPSTTAAAGSGAGSGSSMAPSGTGDAMMPAGMAFGPGCSAVPADGAGSFAGMAADPAATAASNNPVLSTLVSAVQEAGLVDTLNGPGPFTIFAPTNDAFDALPTATRDKVLGDPELLGQVLTYHVVAGSSLDAKALGSAGTETSVEGGALEFGADGTTVNGSDVVCSDVATANATVHIIDQVLVPPDLAAQLSDTMPGASTSGTGASGSGTTTSR